MLFAYSMMRGNPQTTTKGSDYPEDPMHRALFMGESPLDFSRQVLLQLTDVEHPNYEYVFPVAEESR